MRAAALCLVIAVGCGGDGNGRPSVSTTADNVCGQLARVACFNMYSCCAESEIESRLGVTDPRTEDQCITDFERRCDRSLARIEFSRKNNRVRFDSAAMNACLQAIEAPDGTCATVSTMLPWTAACMTSAWVGITPDGGACNFAYECGADSTCPVSQACTPKPRSGQPCGTGCASGLFCNVGMCAPLLSSGQACAATAQCQTGLFCDLAATAPTCTALHETGQACTSNASCASNKCNPGTCAASGNTCTANTQCTGTCSNSPTISCTLDSTCGAGTCSVGGAACFTAGTCNVTGTCVFPNRCTGATCVGAVCADNELTVDYCQGALSALPTVP